MNTQEKPKHNMFYTEAELSLIKNTFCENDELAKQVRNFFLELATPEEEGNVMLNFAEGTENYKLLKKTLLPELEGSNPMFQLMDLLLPTEIKGKDPVTVEIDLLARRVMITYLTEKFNNLAGKYSNMRSFKDLANSSEHADLLARNNLVSYVELQLQKLIILAGKKEETATEKNAKAKKDSTK